MPKYLLIYRDQLDAPQPSPEEMQQFLSIWEGWFKKFPHNIVDAGDGLLPTGRVLKPEGVVADGPYVEAKEMIGGFTVISATSYEEAVDIAKECPIAQIGGAIEIREFAGFV
jgi:hypothetical protein